MMWIYKQIVIPRITYGSIVWWKATEASISASKLKTLQRNALMMVTGATHSTPGAALDALLDIIPLDIKIKETTILACNRLIKANTWSSLERTGVKNLHKEIETITKELADDSTDDSYAPTWNLKRKFSITINERNNWNYGTRTTNNCNCWYTDGSVRTTRLRHI